jgi:hypothetical protein
MLASTVQFSRNKQHTRPAPRKGDTGRPALKTQNPHPRNREHARLYPQDPTACPAAPRPPPPFRPPSRGGVLAGQQAAAAAE